MLFSIHGMLAVALKQPELALEQSEAKHLATATQNVARHYASGQFAEKTMDWINLGMVLSMIYGPRIVRMAQKKGAPAKTVATPPGNGAASSILDQFAPADIPGTAPKFN